LLTVTGWGTTSEGGSISPILKKADVPYVPNSRCANYYQGFNAVTSGMLCAGYEASGGVDACQVLITSQFSFLLSLKASRSVGVFGLWIRRWLNLFVCPICDNSKPNRFLSQLFCSRLGSFSFP
jgi:hypothetical protein